MISLILYGRRRCHLCEVAKEALSRLQLEVDFGIEERDVDDDPAWARAYGDQVPVGFVNGRKVFKYRVEPEAVRRALRAARPVER